jgi:hypothetical protein
MARYQCRACDFDGRAAWHGVLVCPRCGSTTQVRVALATEEMTAQEMHAIQTAASNMSDPDDSAEEQNH